LFFGKTPPTGEGEGRFSPEGAGGGRGCFGAGGESGTFRPPQPGPPQQGWGGGGGWPRGFRPQNMGGVTALVGGGGGGGNVRGGVGTAGGGGGGRAFGKGFGGTGAVASSSGPPKNPGGGKNHTRGGPRAGAPRAKTGREEGSRPGGGGFPFRVGGEGGGPTKKKKPRRTGGGCPFDGTGREGVPKNISKRGGRGGQNRIFPLRFTGGSKIQPPPVLAKIFPEGGGLSCGKFLFFAPPPGRARFFGRGEVGGVTG